jgi:TetR/AcrR family transcriptional regulator
MPKKIEPRGPGRPKAGSIDQRERLLDEALNCFSERGIAATSLRALARRTGLTPAMLNYYFGSKDRLVDAVVAERLLPVIAEIRRGMAEISEDNTAATIMAFVSGMHDSIRRHPWLPALWVREVLSESGHLRDVLVEQIAPEISLPLSQSIADAQSRREINADLDPRLLFVSLIGLTMFPFAAAPIWRRVFDADDIDADTMLAHTAALLQKGLEVSREA